MSKLSPLLKDFLLRNASHYKNRKFLIHILTKSVKPGMEFKKELIEGARTHAQPTYIELTNSLDTPVYPDLKKQLAPETVKELDVINQWVYQNNIPLITENQDLHKLLLQYQNFTSFSVEEQASADMKSKELRDCTNVEYFERVLSKYFQDKEYYEIVQLNDSDGKYYVAEITASVKDIVEKKSVQVCILSDNPEERLMTEIDTLDLEPGGPVPNVTEKMTTTVGRVIVNQLVYVEPFGTTFPFENKVLNLGKGDVVSKLNDALLANKITVAAYKLSLDRVFYLGHFTELCLPCFSEKCLSTSDEVKKKKQELYKKYEGTLNDPETISKIEDELIALDKEYIKGDVSLRFYTPQGGKAFDLFRKKLYITVGGIEAFSDDSSKYEFLRNSLEDGIRVQDLPIYGNESRKGSYQRGHETRKGGAMTKDVIRAFHDSRISIEDCGTKRGVMIDFNKVPIEKFIGRYILLQNKWTELTKDLAKKLPKSSPYLMRSPLYCQCKEGFCYKCVGKLFAELDVRQLSLTIVDISTTFMLASMKNMHGSKLALYELQPNTLDNLVL